MDEESARQRPARISASGPNGAIDEGHGRDMHAPLYMLVYCAGPACCPADPIARWRDGFFPRGRTANRALPRSARCTIFWGTSRSANANSLGSTFGYRSWCLSRSCF